MDTKGNLRVWCLIQDQFAHVKPVEEYFGDRAEFIYDTEWNPEKMLRQQPDILVCVNDFPYGIAQCIEAGRAAQIPSLVLQDGILEWRCQYENPLFGKGGGAPQHQPVFADKIACIGEQSARQIAAWGNAAKVEVTGMPRLDALLNLSFPPPIRPGKRLMIMTAKKPWFDAEQKELTVRSLLDVKAYLETHTDVQVYWRVTKDLASILGVENQLTQLSSGELSEVLIGVDAVITTISTAVLETMLLNRPVAALDYHNVPRFVPTAWTISASEHIPAVVTELLNPPATKLAFQRDCLTDTLSYYCLAAPRVAELITQMVEVARQTIDGNTILRFPPHLVNYNGFSSQNKGWSLTELYPEQSIFAENDIQALQLRLVRLQKENVRLNEELQNKKIGYWVSAFGRFLARKVS